MKRLYLRPEFRGKGIGRTLCEHALKEARAIGYRQLRLDTVEPVMKDAVAMYRRLGFKEIAALSPKPDPWRALHGVRTIRIDRRSNEKRSSALL